MGQEFESSMKCFSNGDSSVPGHRSRSNMCSAAQSGGDTTPNEILHTALITV